MKILKTLGLLALIGLASAKGVSAEAKKSTLSNILGRISISGTYTNDMCDPLKAHYEKMNQEFKDGTTLGYIFPDWKNIESPKNAVMAGIEGKVKAFYFGKNKNWNVNVSGGSEKTAMPLETEYEETYTDLAGDHHTITRNEEFGMEKNSIGLEIEKDFKNFTLGATIKSDTFNINGKGNFEWYIPEAYYTRWADYNFSGIGQGTSVQLEGSYKIGKNSNIVLVAGTRNATIKTSGTETIKLTSAPGWSTTRDYNPEFLFNNSYIGGKLEIKFK